MKKTVLWLSITLIMLISTSILYGQVNARMLRYPDVSATHICFVYAGDIWVVEKGGGTALRLSSPRGEESFPRFSPDGSKIAFSGNYDGNTDIYLIPFMGGELQRLTHHGMSDRIIDWYPDGKAVLFVSGMASGRQRYSQFYRIAKEGGLPDKLPIPYGEFGAVSPDGKTLAYMPISRDFRTWKRYRGGMAPDIWLFDLIQKKAKNITSNVANDAHPMWHGRTLYFLSDRGPNQRYNIWAIDLETENVRQVTNFKDSDIHFPAIGPTEIVFETGGKLFLLDLETENPTQVEINLVTDQITLKPHKVNVARMISNARISPKGKRALFEARGEVFSVPAEHGVIRNLTASSGVAERYPAWSPDGRHIAYWSDRSGEYELTICSAKDGSKEQKLTSYGPGYRYQIYWSPDSHKIAFIDQTMTIYIYNIETKETVKVDQGLWKYEGGLRNFKPGWSPDSRWLAYSRGKANRHDNVFLYDTKVNKRYQVTSGYYNDFQPVFDPEGKHLYFFSNRTFSPIYGDMDNSFLYANTTNIAAVSLKPDIPSLTAPRNDEEELKKEEPEEKAKKQKIEKEKKKKPEKKEVKAVEITIKDFERRLVVLPPKPGNYNNLQAAEGKILYQRFPRTGSGERVIPLVYYDIKERKEQTILGDVDGYRLSADRKKVLVWKRQNAAIVDVKPKQKMEKRLRTGELEMIVDPRAEWRQIFTDAWRLSRDFFYDAGMHGVDWKAMRKQYGALLRDAVTRWDVNYVIGELIAELNASHTYRGGGDIERGAQVGVGYLGIDWKIDSGAYRIAKIIDGAPWDSEVRSPLTMPGVNVKEDDYILAVNGAPLDISNSPWAAFQGLAGKTIELTVNNKPTKQGARKVIIETLRSETRLRNLAWVEENRKYVEEKSGGRIGYIYVPDTSIGGQNELVRQFSAQFYKDGLIVDERFNSGGQIPDRFIELLKRPVLAFWAVRDGKDWQWPPVGHFGPKAMLINGWSGSGGDAFPDYFRKAGLGPLIGTRTWGGLIGMSGAPQLIDGGFVSSPTFRMYDPDGKWFKEGHGVDPDIEVKEDPALLAEGTDPQLKRAVDEVLRMLNEKPFAKPSRPSYEDRTVKKKK
ncbi:MAG: PD40 domain-containing protein [Candidatus Aminicenantes bacterium]|nr:MAG: PD40 domain-containing protein [Candidatus Aminicenantes bacterium]